jgi:hypothetical protein
MKLSEWRLVRYDSKILPSVVNNSGYYCDDFPPAGSKIDMRSVRALKRS